MCFSLSLSLSFSVKTNYYLFSPRAQGLEVIGNALGNISVCWFPCFSQMSDEKHVPF